MAVPTPEVQISSDVQAALQPRLPDHEADQLNKKVNEAVNAAVTISPPQQENLVNTLMGEIPHDSTPLANTQPNIGDSIGQFIFRNELNPLETQPGYGSESADTLIYLEHEKEAKKLGQDFGEKKKGWFKLPWK